MMITVTPRALPSDATDPVLRGHFSARQPARSISPRRSGIRSNATSVGRAGGLCQAQGRRFDPGHPPSLAALHAAIVPLSSCGIAPGDTSPVGRLTVRRAPHDVLRVPVAVAGRSGVEAAVNHELEQFVPPGLPAGRCPTSVQRGTERGAPPPSACLRQDGRSRSRRRRPRSAATESYAARSGDRGAGRPA